MQQTQNDHEFFKNNGSIKLSFKIKLQQVQFAILYILTFSF